MKYKNEFIQAINETIDELNSPAYYIIHESLQEDKLNNDRFDWIFRLIEKTLKHKLEKFFPDIEHPNDALGDVDFVSKRYGVDCELKCCGGWYNKKYDSYGYVWSNGKLADTEKENKVHNFLFLKLTVDNNTGKLVLLNAYSGDMSYADWYKKPKDGDYRIGICKVNQLCEKLI